MDPLVAPTSSKKYIIVIGTVVLLMVIAVLSWWLLYRGKDTAVNLPTSQVILKESAPAGQIITGFPTQLLFGGVTIVSSKHFTGINNQDLIVTQYTVFNTTLTVANLYISKVLLNAGYKVTHFNKVDNIYQIGAADASSIVSVSVAPLKESTTTSSVLVVYSKTPQQ